jgi:hypothetical protein
LYYNQTRKLRFFGDALPKSGSTIGQAPQSFSLKLGSFL